MIRIVENDSIVKMTEYCAGDPYGCRILAVYRTYGLGESFARFWLQVDDNGSITAAIGALDNGVTVCARGEYDTEEIDEFVRMLVGQTGALRPLREGEKANGLVMRLDRSRFSGEISDAELCPPCEDVYTVLENCPGFGFDVPPFEEFYPDMYRRIKSGTAVTALYRSGGLPVSAVALHIAGDTALVTSCATVPASRGSGYASSCVRAVVASRPADTDVYVMCLPGLCAFYERLGFSIVGGYVN